MELKNFDYGGKKQVMERFNISDTCLDKILAEYDQQEGIYQDLTPSDRKKCGA